jgi:CRISPR-associated protein Cas5h
MAIAFEIKGPIALYRKPYTTTSTVSYPIPTPTSVAGLIAAILGIENNSDENSAASFYWHQMKGTRITIQRLNHTSWFTAALNFWNTKNPQKNIHNRISHQFVRNPYYRIFVDGNLSNRLGNQLADGQYYYTPCLGTAYALAETHFLGEFDPVKPSLQDEIEVHSVLPLSSQAETHINFLGTHGIMKDTFPFRLDDTRQVIESITLLYPSSPDRGILLKPWEKLDYFYYQGGAIVWLPSW